MSNCVKCNKKFSCGCEIKKVNGSNYCGTCYSLLQANKKL